MARKGGKDNFLFEDWEDDSNNLMCELCGVIFPDAKAKKTHEMGKKHEKKVNEIKLKAKRKMKAKDSIKYEDTKSESENSEEEICCEQCDISFTGYASYASHLKGTRHNKNVNKQKLKKKQENMAEVLKRDSNSEEDDIFEKVYAKCRTCQKQFSGPEAFAMHLKSANHEKKEMQAKMLEYEKKNKDKDCNDEEIYDECKICEKTFSGIVPYQIHMKSKSHQKNLIKRDSAEKNKDLFDKTDEGYICKECQKPFTDPLAFQNHLDNNSHEKQKAKNALTAFLKENPEIVFATPDKKHLLTNGSDSDELEQLYFLICTVCNASFSGPEPAKAHSKSKMHIATVKEKKSRKLLKLKNEVSSKESNSSASCKEATKKMSSDEQKACSSKNVRKTSTDDFELI